MNTERKIERQQQKSLMKMKYLRKIRNDYVYIIGIVANTFLWGCIKKQRGGGSIEIDRYINRLM